MRKRSLGSGAGPNIIDALRTATRSRHVALASSSAMVRLFDASYTVAEYRLHLGRILGFFEPLERAVALARGTMADGEMLQRSGALREDLRIMGATTSDVKSLARCRIDPIAPRGLRGYTYVILGSMLGADVIVKRLRAVLGSQASFQFYGDGTAGFEALWAAFRSDLEENGKDDVQAICATAAGIFDAYAAWFSEPLAGAYGT